MITQAHVNRAAGSSELARQVFGEVGYHLNNYARRAHIHPLAGLAMARIETGRDVGAELPHNAYFGIHSADGTGWGPVLSGRTAELFGEESLRVPRDYVNCTTEAGTGRAQCYQAYPSTRHGVADWARLIYTLPRYNQWLRWYDPAVQLAGFYASGYSVQGVQGAKHALRVLADIEPSLSSHPWVVWAET